MIGVLVALLLVGTAAGAPTVVHGPLGTAASSGHRSTPAKSPILLVHQNLPGTLYVNTLAMNGAQVLSDELLSNYSYQLVLSNLTPNTTKNLGVMTGGFGIVPGPIVGAGSRYFVSVFNTTNDQEFYYAVSKAGAISPIWTPMGRSPSWSLVYGNATALVVAEPGVLWVLDPMTRAIVANYAAALPIGFLTYAVVPQGHLLYLAGSLAKGNATSADLGVLNQSNGTFTSISPLKYYAPPFGAAFFAAAGATNGQIFVGGGVVYANTTASTGLTTYTSKPFFDRYTPATGKFTNLIALLPAGNETIFGLTPWLGTVALASDTYDFSLTNATLSSGFWQLGISGGNLVNRSGLLPHGFAIEPMGTMASGGSYIAVGGTTAKGTGELVAIRP